MDLLRGIAALWVTYFHLNEPIPFQANAYTIACKLGYLGVPIFFVISGWCMSTITTKTTSAKSFLAARFIRIYPPYIASVILTLGVIGASTLLRGINDLHIQLPKTPLAIAATIAMATKPASSTPGINWAYWTLPVEAGFYVITTIAIIISRLQNRFKPQLTINIFLAIGTAAQLLMNQGTSATPLFWAPFFPLFTIGFSLHSLCHEKTVQQAIDRTAVIGIAGGALALFASSSDPKIAIAAAATCITLSIDFFQAFLIPVNSSPARLISHFGKISYSLYLLHVPIGCYILIRLRPPGLNSNPWLHFAMDTAFIAVIGIASKLFYTKIESPFHRISRKAALWQN